MKRRVVLSRQRGHAILLTTSMNPYEAVGHAGALGRAEARSPGRLAKEGFQGDTSRTWPRRAPRRRSSPSPTIDCANDAATGAGHEDYRISARVDRAVLGDPDSHPVDDVCPRSVTPAYVVDPYPNGKIRDKGCGTKKPDKTRGADVLIDVKLP
jgi:hypothetical protein